MGTELRLGKFEALQCALSKRLIGSAQRQQTPDRIAFEKSILFDFVNQAFGQNPIFMGWIVFDKLV